MTAPFRPVLLPMNRPAARPYRGGAAIERFRRQPLTDQDWVPEDFLASTVATFGSSEVGLTKIGDVFLRDLIREDPIGFLGPDHAARFGADPRLLCKLLNTGERLFVHAHPSAEFAARELHSATGKTEAWIILDIDETGGSAWIGFTDGVADEQLREWYYSQDSDAMLGAMNEVELHPGDTLFVPAGVPHAIGQGVLLLELQEPADLSIILEYAPFPRLARDAGLLGMDVGTALAGIDRSSFAGERLADAVGAVPASGSGPLFPHAAGSFFRAEAVSVDAQTTARWEPQFAILVITEGSAVLESEAGHMDVAEGDVALIPHGAGDNRLTGDARGFRCMPPEPEM